MHIPAGRTVELLINTGDVVHSFWPPRFAGKRDVFPSRETRLWFKADSTGDYSPASARSSAASSTAGWPSTSGRRRRTSSTPGWRTCRRWVRSRRRPRRRAKPGDSLKTASAGGNARVAQDARRRASRTRLRPPRRRAPSYAQGEKLFLAKGCVGCHSLQAVDAPKGMIGPNLANVGARSYIAAGWLKNTDENLARWIREPQTVKKGVLMPNLGVTADEAKALGAYLRAHQ